MSIRDTKLNWDPSKKAKRDAERQEAQRTEEAKAVMKQCRMVYERSEQLMRKKAKRAKGITPAEIMQIMSDLYQQIDIATADKPLLENYRKMTLTLIEDKRAQVIAAKLGEGNHIIEVKVVPAVFGAENDNGPSAAPQVAAFNTEEELLAVPWVKTWTEKEGYFGLLRDGRVILAAYGNGDLLTIGTVHSMMGLEKIPTKKAFLEEMKAKLDKPEKN